MKKKVNIIIPVYNIEKYLSQCLESIVVQSYSNFDVILIDDGSTDSSSKICDTYASKYNNIFVYHKDNEGVSKARNFGLNVASSEYVMFIDSDDVVDQFFVEKMVNNINDVDMCVCGYYEYYVNSKINVSASNDKKIFRRNDMINQVFCNKGVIGSACNKIFKKSVIDSFHLRFNEKIYMCEDMLFVIEYICHIDKTKVIDDSLYYYRMRKSSTVWNVTEKTLTIFDSYNLMIDLIKPYCCIHLYKKYVLELVRYKNYINDQNKISCFKKIVYNSDVLCLEEKIKFFIQTNLNFIYIQYINFKLKKYNRFE